MIYRDFWAKEYTELKNLLSEDEYAAARSSTLNAHYLWQTLENKQRFMGIRSLSAYIRKMALDGYCLHLDLKELRRMAYLLQMCSNNLNQYVKERQQTC